MWATSTQYWAGQKKQNIPGQTRMDVQPVNRSFSNALLPVFTKL